MNEIENDRSAGYYLGIGGLLILGVAAVLFLGKHSLNYFTSTFSAEDEIFSYLGLAFTSAGALIWILVFMYVARTGKQKAISMVMLLVSAVGELLVAGFDMIMTRMDLRFTPDEVETQIWIVAALGFSQAIALALFHIGDKLEEAFRERKKPTANSQISVASHPLKIGNPNGASVPQGNHMNRDETGFID